LAVLAGLGLCLILLNPAHGAQGGKPAPAGGPAAAIAELKATIELLERADHDYAGHRVKAIHEIHAAIHALTSEGKPPAGGQPQKGQQAGKGQHAGQGHAPGKGQAAGKGQATGMPHKSDAAGKKLREPQAVSDAQLNKALQQLKAVQGQLDAGHAQAKASLKAAVHELQTALKIR
jgi:hypothetical protein